MGFSGDPSYVVQNQLYTGIAGQIANRDPAGVMVMGVNDLQTFLNSNFTIANPNIVNEFFGQYFNGKSMPNTMATFTQALVAYVNTHGGTIPPGGETQIHVFLINTVTAAAMLQFGPDGGPILAALSSFSSAPATLNDIYNKAFKEFINGFQYAGTTVFGNNPTIVSPNAPPVVNATYFLDRFNEFFFQFASVANSTSLVGIPNASGTMINFQDIFTAYLGNNPTAFEQFLANYINEIVNGKGQSFLPSQDVGAWLEKVQQAYTISLKGSGAPLISSVGQTTRKVDILLRIYSLLVEMIGTLQKVAAAQSDRLQLLSTWTGAYTNLQTQVPTFTAGDGTIFGGTYGNNSNTTNVAITSRDDANSLNQTFTETIRSRRTQVDNAAKSMQNNLNQSNDNANQQSDAATTILQNLRSILSALYR